MMPGSFWYAKDLAPHIGFGFMTPEFWNCCRDNNLHAIADKSLLFAKEDVGRVWGQA